MVVCLKRVEGFEYSNPIDMKRELSSKESNWKSLHSFNRYHSPEEIAHENNLTFFFEKEENL